MCPSLYTPSPFVEQKYILSIFNKLLNENKNGPQTQTRSKNGLTYRLTIVMDFSITDGEVHAIVDHKPFTPINSNTI